MKRNKRLLLGAGAALMIGGLTSMETDLLGKSLPAAIADVVIPVAGFGAFQIGMIHKYPIEEKRHQIWRRTGKWLR